ncbi:MAG: hypothetical protein U0694_16710 [Anaerolineae bacterium]
MPKKMTPEEQQQFDAILRKHFADLAPNKPTPAPPAEGEVICPACNGQGSLRQERNILFLATYTRVVQCAKCGGSGKIKA